MHLLGVCLMPYGESGGLSKEFLKMRKLVLRERARRKRVLFEDARIKAKDVAKMLKEKYGVKQVYLYGSLAWGGFAEGSDIDLFAVGFEGNYWEMYNRAERIAFPFEVSIVCEEDALPSLKEEVLKRGLLL